ncbi:MAG TPA: hypothetical protein EYP67_07140 [Methanosarcinales archaeon]|nr:hypothetical protein [Methanosarcinales archaeon]
MNKCIYNAIVLVITALLVMAAPVAAYTIDGDCSDWGIYPTNDPSNPDRLDDSSLIPTIGGISYVIDNDNADWAEMAVSGNMSNFTGPEWCDIEAMYVDDDSDYIYVLLITSMPKDGMWYYEHIQPGDLALDFDSGTGIEYGVKIVQNDEQGEFGIVGAIYSDPVWKVLDYSSGRSDITNIIGGDWVGNATIKYTGTGGDPIPGIAVPDGPVDSGLPWDTFGLMKPEYGDAYDDNPPIPNEVIEIAIPKSALNLQNTMLNLQSSPSCGNGIIKLESVTLVPEFITLAIPVLSLLGLAFYMRRREQK